MKWKTAIVIALGWVLAAALFAFSILYNPPLAGASLLVMVMSVIMATVAPIINIGVAWYQIKRGKHRPIVSVFITVGVMFLVLVIFAASGIFNFT